MIFLGIDTDTKGSIAVFDHGHNTLTVYKMPSMTVEINDSDRLRIDRDALAKLMLRIFARSRPDVIVFEKQWARPAIGKSGKKEQGIASTFTFADAYGIIQGVVYATVAHSQFADPSYKPQIEGVAGSKWKSAFNLSADKGEAVALASKFFPRCAGYWSLKKNVSAAEASLVALYGALVCARVPINVNRTLPLDMGLLDFKPIACKS